MVKAELAKGVRKDSVLLGLHFGEDRFDFYSRCTELNEQRLISEGEGGVFVKYIFSDSITHHPPVDIKLLFYPRFDSLDRIYEVYMKFSYNLWSPWDRKTQSDSLENHIKRLFVKWYGGNQFVTAHVNDSTSFPVKVDGNRRVILEVNDAESVVAEVQDILHPTFRHSTGKL